MGDVGGVPELGAVAGDSEEVGDVLEFGGGVDVGGIETGFAVGDEDVVIDGGWERLGGDGPYSGGVFGHRHGLGEVADVQHDLGSAGIFVAEGDGVVGMDLGGLVVDGWGLGADGGGG